MKKRNVYLDHAAATPLRVEVCEAMEPYLTDGYGNPSSIHALGVRAREAVEEARAEIASLLGVRPLEIVFTGSGTEANNLALWGVLSRSEGALVTTPIEHASVLEPARWWANSGREVRWAEVDNRGRVDHKDLKAKLEGALLLSVIYGNNEIGTVQEIRELAKLARRAGALIHTDACQASGVLELDPIKLGVDLMTLNAAKIGGPKGVGLLYQEAGVELEPLVRGGGQERGVRAGTENVAGIVGFATALRLARQGWEGTADKMRDNLEYFKCSLQKVFPEVRFNGDAESSLPGITSATFPGVDGEALLLYLDAAGVSASSGSACEQLAGEASSVLTAIGLSPEEIRSTVRFSLGPETTREDLEYAADLIPGILAKIA